MPPYLCVWATARWCVPCKRLQPGWFSLAEPDGDAHHQFAKSVAFAVADLTDEDVDGATLSEAMRIVTLPTFVLYQSATAQEVGRAEGAAHKRPARRLFDMLKQVLAE